MNRLFFTLAMTMTAYLGAVDYPELSARELESFNNQMSHQLELSRERIHELLQEIGEGKHIINPAARVELESLKGSLKTKETLVNNFRNAPSLRSSVIRQRLLDILKKKLVSLDDVYDLQDIVEKEKKRMISE